MTASTSSVIYDPESGIGIRIEDVVVVTEDGCLSLIHISEPTRPY